MTAQAPDDDVLAVTAAAASAVAATHHVAFVESFSQPHESSSSPELAGADGSCARRPSLVLAGDVTALETVRTVHSPRGQRTSVTAPSFCAAGSPHRQALNKPTTPAKVVSGSVGPWRRRLWHAGWAGPTEIIVSTGVFALSMHWYGQFLRWQENRTDIAGYALVADPLLELFEARDFSLALSVLVYGTVVAGFRYAARHPDVFFEIMQTHTLTLWIRMLTLYVTPLEAPRGTIPLIDPIAHPDGAVLVRDLLFSGHTATCFTLFIGIRRVDRGWKLAIGLVTAITAVLVVWQKAHYTIDVLAAPSFVYSAHGMVVGLRRLASEHWGVVAAQRRQQQQQQQQRLKAKKC